MRYSGLRISDAVSLTTDRLDGKLLYLYTQKTKTAAYTVLPDFVLQALEAPPKVTATRFFLDGQRRAANGRVRLSGKAEERFQDGGNCEGII